MGKCLIIFFARGKTAEAAIESWVIGDSPGRENPSFLCCGLCGKGQQVMKKKRFHLDFFLADRPTFGSNNNNIVGNRQLLDEVRSGEGEKELIARSPSLSAPKGFLGRAEQPHLPRFPIKRSEEKNKNCPRAMN